MIWCWIVICWKNLEKKAQGYCKIKWVCLQPMKCFVISNNQSVVVLKFWKEKGKTCCCILKAVVCLWEKSVLKAIWSTFEVNIGIMAKFSYLPENKRYKIIHLKEEGYSMCQIAVKVPCGFSTIVRNWKDFLKQIILRKMADQDNQENIFTWKQIIT